MSPDEIVISAYMDRLGIVFMDNDLSAVSRSRSVTDSYCLPNHCEPPANALMGDPKVMLPTAASFGKPCQFFLNQTIKVCTLSKAFIFLRLLARHLS